MSSENGKVCCNCRHNIRTGEIGKVVCNCDIDGHYISYTACFENWCRHWASDRKYWDEVKDER